MKISIVTPTYNSAKFVEDAIQSVLKQNYSDFEHIIIDGGSTDGTLEILKKYPHLNWVSEPDEGQSDALNKGFKKATGSILGWLNSDDVYLDGVFQNVMNVFLNSGIDGVYANYYFTDPNLIITKKQRSHRVVKWLSLFHCYIPSTTFFFKREIIDQNIFIDKTIHISMDKDFFAHILYAGYNLKYINNEFAYFRWHDGNKSIDNKEIKQLRIDEGFNILKKYSPKLSVLIRSKTIYRLISNFSLIYRKFLKATSF